MRIATATALAAVAAVVANLLLRAGAVAILDIPQPGFEPLQARAVALSTLGGVIAAGVVYAVIERLARDPARVFVIVAAIALLLSLYAPLTVEDGDAGSVGTLIAMHVVAAAISVSALVRISPR
jgi:Family of unknown function (DUF6069)